jgi:hypothetical protein
METITIQAIETAATSVAAQVPYVSVRFKAFRQKNKVAPIDLPSVRIEYSKQVRFAYSVGEYLKTVAEYLQKCNNDGIALYDKSFVVYASEPTTAKQVDFFDDIFRMKMTIMETAVLLHGNSATMKDDLIAGKPQKSTSIVCRNIAQSFIGRQHEIDLFKLAESIKAQYNFGDKVVKNAVAEAKFETLTRKQQIVLQGIAIKAKERRTNLKDYKVVAIRGIAMEDARKTSQLNDAE